MKNMFLIVFISALLCSCCVFSSMDCFCKPSTPYLIETTKDWIAPLQSEDIVFKKQASTDQQTINRNYFESTECVGGDECCADFPVHVAEFTFSSSGSIDYLLYTKAITDEVQFLSKPDGYFMDIVLTSLNVNTGMFSKSDSIDLIEKDTLINGLTTKKLLFRKTNLANKKILFTKIEFVKGIGVTGFTDLKGVVWNKQ